MIGSVHPSLPSAYAWADEIQRTITHGPLTADEADRLCRQLEGVAERVAVLLELAVARAQELTGRV